MKTLAFATCARIADVHEDDAPVLPYLRELGWQVQGVPWDQPGVDWGAFDAIVIRTTWDYYHKPEAFKAWLHLLSTLSCPVLNPPNLMRWNLDKYYLHELQAKGIALPPTRWLGNTHTRSLWDTMYEMELSQAVVKPAISAGSYLTWVQQHDAIGPEDEARWQSLKANGGGIVQAYLPQLVAEGEVSLIYFNGEYSHAVLKKAKTGEFRVQVPFGGSIEAWQPDAVVLAMAQDILRQIEDTWLFARVDLARWQNRWVLMELELLEPLLYLAWGVGAPERFANAVAARLVGIQAH